MKSLSELVHCALLGIVLASVQSIRGKPNIDEDAVHHTKTLP